MPSRPSDAAQRIIDLAVGKSCVVTTSQPASLMKTAKGHRPDAVYVQEKIDSRYVIRRTA